MFMTLHDNRTSNTDKTTGYMCIKATYQNKKFAYTFHQDAEKRNKDNIIAQYKMNKIYIMITKNSQ